MRDQDLGDAVLESKERIFGISKVKEQFYVSYTFPGKKDDNAKEAGSIAEESVSAQTKEVGSGDACAGTSSVSVNASADTIAESGDGTTKRPRQELDDRDRNPGKKRKKKSWAVRKREKAKAAKLVRGHVPRPDWENLCAAFAQGKACPAGDPSKCRFSHNIEEYLRKKPPLLSELECQAFKNNGYCPFGIRCLSGHKHLLIRSSSSQSKKDEQIASAISFQNLDVRGEASKTAQNLENVDSSYNLLGESNFLRRPVQTAIRKRTYFGAALDDLKEPRPMPNFSSKVYIAPLTTVGNLPFRRIHKDFGADITCGEMALAKDIASGELSEWSLLRRHKSEDIFGVQIAGGRAEVMGNAAELILRETDCDFIDVNLGCPIDLVCNQGAGSALLNKTNKLAEIVECLTTRTEGRIPIGLKVRTGWLSRTPTSHTLAAVVQGWRHTMPFGRSIAYLSMHGRSRQARYTNVADWDFIARCNERTFAAEALWRKQNPSGKPLAPVPFFGNGDVLSYTDWYDHMGAVADWVERLAEIESECLESKESRLNKTLATPEWTHSSKFPHLNVDDEDTALENIKAKLTTLMIGRGALIKPWIATEIKEQRHWDISGSERMDIFRSFCNYGLEHWGSDSIGVQKTRRFLLEWMSFTCRYVPIGVLDATYVPQHMNDRPPIYRGRDDRETQLSSFNVSDWIKLSEMFLGKAPDNFTFEPKHKSNSYNPDAEKILALSGPLKE